MTRMPALARDEMDEEQKRVQDSLNAKGNFSFERRVEGWRDRPVVDMRHKG